MMQSRHTHDFATEYFVTKYMLHDIGRNLGYVA
jgi:hypothetical protein